MILGERIAIMEVLSRRTHFPALSRCRYSLCGFGLSGISITHNPAKTPLAVDHPISAEQRAQHGMKVTGRAHRFQFCALIRIAIMAAGLSGKRDNPVFRQPVFAVTRRTPLSSGKDPTDDADLRRVQVFVILYFRSSLPLSKAVGARA